MTASKWPVDTDAKVFLLSKMAKQQLSFSYRGNVNRKLLPQGLKRQVSVFCAFPFLMLARDGENYCSGFTPVQDHNI